MSEHLVAIVAALAKSAAAQHEDFEARALAAFRAARGNGLVTDEEIQFQGGLAAIARSYMDEGNDEMIERIKEEVQGLKTLRAMMSGVPVDISRVPKREHDPLGLMNLWHASTDKAEVPAEEPK